MSIRKSIVSKCLYMAVAVVFIGSTLTGMPASADSAGTITEYDIPTPNSGPHSITEGPDGNLWFIESNSGKIGKMTKSGVFTEYSSGISQPPLVGDIAAGHDSRVWFTDPNSPQPGTVKAIDDSGSITTYPPLVSVSGESVGAISAGPGFEMWFGVINLSNPGDFKGYIRSITTGGISVRDIPVDGYITSMAPDYATNSMWYTSRQMTATGFTGKYMIGRITADGNKIEYDASTTPLGSITKGPDGNMWFVDHNDKVGKIDSLTNITKYSLPGSNVGVRSIAAGPDGFLWATLSNTDQIARINTAGMVATYAVPNVPPGRGPTEIIKGSDGNMWFTQFEGGQIAKIGTFGGGIPVTDTDGDGLSDFVESQDYPDRDAIFCGSSCEHPNPSMKDIYIEVDWMNNPGGFLGFGNYSMKPTSTQINMMKAAFQQRGIALHVDTGQLGGGNQIPYNSLIKFDPTPGSVDFFDYKLGGDGVAPQFNQSRYHIYHYALMGQAYTYRQNNVDITNSTGVSYIGDDDLFVSYGVLKDTNWWGLDTALAGTFIHELGHNLCLSNSANGVAYEGQPESCRYSGVDKFVSNKYNSSMNYTRQKYLVDYSTGANGSPNDHNDWAAIRLGDFASSIVGDMAHGSNDSTKVEKDKKRRVTGPTVNQLLQK